MTFDAWLHAQRDDRAARGLTRSLTPRSTRPSTIDLAGNDYLGLRRHPTVCQAAADAALIWGAGAGASRLVTGTLDLHCELEDELAAFTGSAAALVHSTGYHANLAAVTALTDRDTLLVSDAHVHASLVDACRLARPGRLVVAPHNDVGAVRDQLASRSEARALVLVESVYSVLGDAAPLLDLVAAVDTYDGVLVVDEAHALGVSGDGGRGLVAAAGLADRSDVLVTATLSKALGAQGGVVLGSTAVVQHLVNTARPFIYDTALAPPAAAAALAALRVVNRQPDLPQLVLNRAGAMAAALGQPLPAGAVLSTPLTGPAEALQAQAALAEVGIQVGCFRPPSTPDGSSRLRITASAGLTSADLAHVLDALGRLETPR